MTDIILVKQQPVEITEADREAVRRVLFGIIDGLSEQHKKSWRRLINWFLKKAQPGEMVELKTHRDRLGLEHRRHMLMEQRVFEQQETFEHFDAGFRPWLKIGAGFCTWHPGTAECPLIPIPKSISYAACEQDEFDRFHEASVDFLRSEHAQSVLWPHLSLWQRHDMMEFILVELKQ